MKEQLDLISLKDELTIDSHRIEDHSVFGDYSQAENRVTNALLKILKIAGPDLIDMLIDKFGGEVKNPMPDILTQVPLSSNPNEKRVADGLIVSNYSYKILIEAKVRPFNENYEHNIKQLDAYKQIVSPDDDEYLLYITPDEDKPKEIGPNIFWLSWSAIVDLLTEYILGNADPILKFLVKEFIILITKLVTSKMKSKRKEDDKKETERIAKKNVVKMLTSINNGCVDDENVVIVGGRWGENIAVRYGFYACQPDRFFAPARFFAFYFDNRIKYLFEIVQKEDRVKDLRDNLWHIDPDYFTSYDTKYAKEMNKERELFILNLVHIFDGDGIVNDAIDKNGKRCAFTQKQRYTSYRKIIKAHKTSEL